MQPQFDGGEHLGAADKRYKTLYAGSVDVTGAITLAGGHLSARGVLGSGAPAATSNGTSEEVLATVTIPPDALLASGYSLRVLIFAHTAANGNNKRLRVRIGGIAGTVVADTGDQAANNNDIVATVHATRTGATTCSSAFDVTYVADKSAATPTKLVYTDRAAAVTWANSNALVITTTDGTAAVGTTLDSYVVEVLR